MAEGKISQDQIAISQNELVEWVRILGEAETAGKTSNNPAIKSAMEQVGFVKSSIKAFLEKT